MLSDSPYSWIKAELAKSVSSCVGRADYRSCAGLAISISRSHLKIRDCTLQGACRTDRKVFARIRGQQPLALNVMLACGIDFERVACGSGIRSRLLLVLTLILWLPGCGLTGHSSGASFATSVPTASATTSSSGANNSSLFNRLLKQSDERNQRNHEWENLGKTRRVVRDFVMGLNQLGKSDAKQSSWWVNHVLRMPFPENDFDVELLRELQQAKFRILESNNSNSARSLVYTVTRHASQSAALSQASPASQVVSSYRPDRPYRFEVVVEDEYVLSRDYHTDQDRAYPLGPMTLENLATGSVQALSVDHQTVEELSADFGRDRSAN